MAIAFFSKRRALIYALGFLAACALMYGVTLYHPQGVTWIEYTNSKGAYRYQFAFAAWIAGALLIVRTITILKQIILHRSSAAWTSGDRLFYLNIYWDIVYRSVALSDIIDYRIKTGLAASAGIVVRLRGGQEIVMSTWLLSEPTEVVMSRLVSLRCADGQKAEQQLSAISRP